MKLLFLALPLLLAGGEDTPQDFTFTMKFKRDTGPSRGGRWSYTEITITSTNVTIAQKSG